MSPKSSAKPLKITKALLCLNGKDGDIVVGNGENYNPMYIENGKPFLELLDNIKKYGTSSIEQELLDLLRVQNILLKQEAILKQLPALTDTCCGRTGEQTIILPLTEKTEDEVYENFLDYAMKNVSDYGSLTIKFHGRDPMLHWPLVEKVVKLINRKIESRADIQLKYHFDSSLDKLSEDILGWMKQQNIVSLSVFSPLPNGSMEENQKYDTIKENVKKLNQAYVKVCLITPVVSGNIHKLQQIAECYANLKVSCGFEFPAIRNPAHPWEYGSEKDLPAADEYSQVLVDIYRRKYIDDYLFVPVNELRHRVIHGGYGTGCSCLYNHVAALDANGNVYPCLNAMGIEHLCLGSITDKPENNLKLASDNFKGIPGKSWGTRTKWPWRGLCGLHCPLSNNLVPQEDRKKHMAILEEYFYKPRLSLLSEIIWDIVKENKQQHNQS